MKGRLAEEIRRGTELFSLHEQPSGLTAGELADRLTIRRNTASHYLNQLVSEGTLFKINTRPVFFLHRACFEQRFFGPVQTEYGSVEQLRGEQGRRTERGVMDEVIGGDGSLSGALEQIRAAMLYPGQGLPVIFGGPTGVGKSFLAKVMHGYCIETGTLDARAPFVTFNCAQYANNPELVTANLFGYVKGAFTGADANKAGALEAADGGVLFLDEIHRLSAEGQEKLFVFMDQGKFQRLGESGVWRGAKVRLTFATTEPLEDALLGTFLRRIPVTVTLPGLDKRGDGEKTLHILSALLDEVATCARPAEITYAALAALQNHHFKGSVGELRNVVKLMFARLYSRDQDAQTLKITLYDLPDNVLGARRPTPDGARAEEGTIFMRPGDTAQQLLAANTLPHQAAPHKTLTGMFTDVLALFARLQAGEVDAGFFRENAFFVIQAALVQMMDELSYTGFNNRYQCVLSDVQAALREADAYLGYQFDESGIAGAASYFYRQSGARVRAGALDDGRLGALHQYLLDTTTAAAGDLEYVIALLGRKLDCALTVRDRVFLMLYFRYQSTPRKRRVRVLVAAQGLAARSVATCANRRLGNPLVEALDLPLQAAEDEILQRITAYIMRNQLGSDLFILTDLVRVDVLTRYLQEVATVQVVVTDFISVGLAAEAGRMAEAEATLDEMWRLLPERNRPVFEMVYPKGRRQKAVIVCCVSGAGTAHQLKGLLEASIPPQLDILVVVQNSRDLQSGKLAEAVFHLFEVVAIVGTVDPEIEGVHFVSLDHLISGDGQDIIRAAFSPIADEETVRAINNNIVKNFSLYSVVNNLTILDTEKMLHHAEEVLTELERLTNKPLPNDKKISLYVHLSCMVERLVRQVPLAVYQGSTSLEQCQKNVVENLRSALSVIEYKYSVKIPDSELAYILDILQLKTTVSDEYL